MWHLASQSRMQLPSRCSLPRRFFFYKIKVVHVAFKSDLPIFYFLFPNLLHFSFDSILLTLWLTAKLLTGDFEFAQISIVLYDNNWRLLKKFVVRMRVTHMLHNDWSLNILFLATSELIVINFPSIRDCDTS